MRSRAEQFTIRDMMGAVAFVAFLLMLIKFIRFVIRGGLHSLLWALLVEDLTLSGHLPPGRAVVVLQDCEAADFRGVMPSSRQDFDDLDERNAPKLRLTAGDSAAVQFDPGDDDDSDSRSVALKLVGGPHRGSIVSVRRGSVREP